MDGLLNGQEIQIVVKDEKVYAKLISDPTNVDSDEDGIQDKEDKFPLHFDTSEMLVYNSKFLKGIDKNVEVENSHVPLYVSDDLTYNDYSYMDLIKVDPTFVVAEITPEFMIWGELYMLVDFGSSGSSEMNTVLNEMFDLFKTGKPSTGDIVTTLDLFDETKYLEFRNSTLNENVKKHESTENFLKITKDEIMQRLSSNNGNLNKLAYDFEKRNKEGTLYNELQSISNLNPNFSEWDKGLSLAIHAFHSNNITVKDYKFDGKRYSGKLHYTLYDHFGLDSDDISFPIQLVGFVDWFALQHHDRYDGEYKPFITVVELEIDFEGEVY